MTNKEVLALSALKKALEAADESEAAESGPSLRFIAAASQTPEGPTAGEVRAAIGRLEAAQAANDKAFLGRALLGLVQAIGV